MPAPEPDRSVQQSLLDRLIDREPDSRVEGMMTRAQSMRGLKASLRRDLEWLLNTTRDITPVPEGFSELQDSLFTYGLPDINSIRLQGSQDETRLLRALEEAVERFEPRLTRVKVIPLQPLTKQAHALRFQIEGLLMIDPAPEQVSFDTVLEVSRGAYEVKTD